MFRKHIETILLKRCFTSNLYLAPRLYLKRDFLTGLFFIVCICCIPYLLLPTITLADTRYEDKVFTQNITLSKANQPYYFSGQTRINQDVEVVVEEGVHVYIDGAITLMGRLALNGASNAPIFIESTSINQKPITLIGGDLFATNIQVTNSNGFLDAFATSTVFLDNSRFEHINSFAGSSVITVWGGSVLDIKNSTFKDINSFYGIEIFNQSFANISTTSFERVGNQTSIVSYNSSILSISKSSFLGSLSNEKALEIWNDSHVNINLSSFEEFGTVGISLFSNAIAEITNTTFYKNKTGIESYNSNIQILQSEIFGNIDTGAILYGGSIDATNNWWGSETGPKSIEYNPNGQGDVYQGSGAISPWKDKKDIQKPVCCSSILFIPGMQGSRIYKKSTFTENQLWEPNSNSDVKKLYLNDDGYSIDKTLYLRDIIDRTNITYGGDADIEIYKGLIHSLNGLNTNYSIEDWQFAAYDWRMSPNTVVTEGTKYGGKIPTGKEIDNFQYIQIEDQITQMVEISKTQKVTLVAHSYGGLVTKRLLTHLIQKGKIGLIDKVIFVAVPEQGSPNALFALLHGDNQDIGSGFIVSKSIMRKFAQHMPSIYSLLPKTISQSTGSLIYGMSATNTVATAVPSVSSISNMYKFIFNELTRPSTVDWVETNIPIIGNKKVKEKIDIESTSTFVKPQVEPDYENIRFYNILGVGLDTVESISYTKGACGNTYMHPLLMSSNCGLDHYSNFSPLGDGVVLATDVFEDTLFQTNTVLNTLQNASTKRWGEKYIFNIAEYNRKKNKNYSHSNIISSPPVVSTLMQIFLNNIGVHDVLPEYMTRHGGVLYGGNSSGSTAPDAPDTIGISEIKQNANTLISNVYDVEKYQISASDSVVISTKDKLDNYVGINFPALTDSKTTQVIPVKTTIPNSSVSHIGSAYYVRTEVLPSTVTLSPDSTMISQQADNEVPLEIDFRIKEFLPIQVQQDSIPNKTDIENSTKDIAVFENIPITEYSKIDISIESSTSSPQNTTPQPIEIEMKVTNVYDNIFSETILYKVSPSISSYPVLVQTPDQSESGSSEVGGNGGTGNNNGSTTISETGQSFIQPIDIENLIEIIRSEISTSGLRSNFKNRYLLKLKSIEKNYKSPLASKKRQARSYTDSTTISLASIIKDLNRPRFLYYRGGMNKPEASFLYSRFVKLSNAFQSLL
jgi:hypothetical protein